MNPYNYAHNNSVLYTDPNGEFVVTALALGLFAYGTYQVLDDFSETAESFGSSYGKVLDVAGEPMQKEGEYDAAVDEFRRSTGVLQLQTINTALKSYIISFTAAAAPATTVKGLFFDAVRDWVLDTFIDKVVVVPAPRVNSVTIQQQVNQSVVSRHIRQYFSSSAWNLPSSSAK